MADRGPVPKRSIERRRRNKVDEPDVVHLEAPVKVPRVDSNWHPIARDWFKALGESGQAQFYEPSDWQAARFVAAVMTKNLKQTKFSAVLFAAVWSAMNDLLTTEGARRRVRMEIERGPRADAPDSGVTALADYKRRAGIAS